MPDFAGTIEHHLKLLKASIATQDSRSIDKGVQVLENVLLDTNAFLSIGDERLLGEALRLLEMCYDEKTAGLLDGLRTHLASVRSVHRKLYSIFDPSVDLPTLLATFGDWPELGITLPTDLPEELKEQLHKFRNEKDSEQRLRAFMEPYLAYMEEQGYASRLPQVKHWLDLALEGYKRAHNWTVHGLFALDGVGDVYGVKVNVRQGSGAIRALDTIDVEMEKAARRAMACVRDIWPGLSNWDVTWEIARDDVPLAGNSLGLALAMGILARTENFDVDAYTAFTGSVEWNTGNIQRVEEIPSKLQAASELGIRRVYIPQDNAEELDLSQYPDLQIVPVITLRQVKEHLQNQEHHRAHTPLEQLADVRIQRLEVELAARGVKKVSVEQRNDYCKRVNFSNLQQLIPVDVFYSKSLKVLVLGADSALKSQVREVCDGVFEATAAVNGAAMSGAAASDVDARGREKYMVPADMRGKVETFIFGREDSVREVEQNCAYRAKVTKGQQIVFVRQYMSGTLTVDGSRPLFDEVNRSIRAVLGMHSGEIPALEDRAALKAQVHSSAIVLQDKLSAQIAAVQAVELGEQWIGTDESGKGDYFGPLVGAAVLVDMKTAELLREAGVQDSKTLNDNRNRALAEHIRELCGQRAHVVTIPPDRYNTLYIQFQAEGKNLNTLLAWAHARALENILTAFPQQEITVVVDKFADERYIKSKLLEKGRETKLNLVQLPKAEANIAVAAASVLARAQFLDWLERLSRHYGVVLPKGASDPRVAEIARQIVAARGRDELAKVAKLHFKTTEKVLG